MAECRETAATRSVGITCKRDTRGGGISVLVAGLATLGSITVAASPAEGIGTAVDPGARRLDRRQRAGGPQPSARRAPVRPSTRVPAPASPQRPPGPSPLQVTTDPPGSEAGSSVLAIPAPRRHHGRIGRHGRAARRLAPDRRGGGARTGRHRSRQLLCRRRPCDRHRRPPCSAPPTTTPAGPIRCRSAPARARRCAGSRGARSTSTSATSRASPRAGSTSSGTPTVTSTASTWHHRGWRRPRASASARRLRSSRAAYPTVSLIPGEESIQEPTFYVDESLRGLVTDVADDGVVTVIIGGEACGF